MSYTSLSSMSESILYQQDSFTGANEIDEYIFTFLDPRSLIGILRLNKRVRSIVTNMISFMRNDNFFSCEVNTIMSSYILSMFSGKYCKKDYPKLERRIIDLIMNNYYIIGGVKNVTQSSIFNSLDFVLRYTCLNPCDMFIQLVNKIKTIESEMGLESSLQDSIILGFAVDESLFDSDSWLKIFLKSHKNYNLEKWYFPMIASLLDIYDDYEPYESLLSNNQTDPIRIPFFFTSSCMTNHDLYIKMGEIVSEEEDETKEEYTSVRIFLREIIRDALENRHFLVNPQSVGRFFSYCFGILPMRNVEDAQELVLKLIFQVKGQYPAELVLSFYKYLEIAVFESGNKKSISFLQLEEACIKFQEAKAKKIEEAKKGKKRKKGKKGKINNNNNTVNNNIIIDNSNENNFIDININATDRTDFYLGENDKLKY